MTRQAHSMMPHSLHDEAALQDFATSFRAYLSSRIMPGNFEIYEKEILPRFRRQHGRAPLNGEEVRREMTQNAYYQLWSALQRRSQEIMWEAVTAPTERQLPELVSRFRNSLRASDGVNGPSLRLDPKLEIPRYHTVHDIHIQPGGYHTDQTDDDVTAGVLYETGLAIYIPGALGEYQDLLGRITLGHYRQAWPDRIPCRIIDLGCAVGNSTGPWVSAFPSAEVQAVDVGAPVLRYGFARAHALGLPIHFSQQNAEATDFPSESFDVVVSHLLLHETSRKALPRILAESRRLLRPGGIMMHLDLPPRNDVFRQFMEEWESYNNNESFARFIRHIDLIALAQSAGWPQDSVQDMLLGAPTGNAEGLYSPGEFKLRVLVGVR